IREPEGAIEREGIRRSLEHARAAELVLWLSDTSQASAPLPPEVQARRDKYFLRLASKIDIPGPEPLDGSHRISARTGVGLPELIASIAARAAERIGDQSAPAITRARYREQLKGCMNALHAFMNGASEDQE